MSVQHTTAGWARAMTAALAETVSDTAVMAAGRRLLAAGAMGPLNINKGFATSKTPLDGGQVARPRLQVSELSDPQWDQIEHAITALPDAETLAGTVAVSDLLTDPARTGGVALVPAPQDITHTCTCTPGDSTLPCAHTAALGLLLADRFRTAPAPLFTLRGRPHQHLKTRLRDQRDAADRTRTEPPRPEPALHATSVPAPPAPRPAAPAAEPPLPIPAPVDLDLTGTQPVLSGPLAAPPPPLPELEAWRALTADAAHRAGTALGRAEPHRHLDTGSDIARLLALPHGAPFRQAAMDHLGLNLIEMGHLQLAYTHGGPDGAATYLEPFTVDHHVLAGAQADIQHLRPAALATVECHDNRLTDQAAGIQLRYGPDGRWYPYRTPYGIWQPVPGPSADPARAYRAARKAARSPRRTA